MTPSPMRRRIRLIGGGANAARALRGHLADRDQADVRVHVRGHAESGPGETIVRVTHYDADIGPADAAICFVGAVTGSEAALRQVNVDLVERIGKAAKQAGVRTFIQLGTLAVYGAAERLGHSTPERPESAYGRTKQEGERRLLALADADFRVVILRVPTLYGDGMPGKILSLASAVRKFGVLPLAPLSAQRSTLHVHNLAMVLEGLVESDASGVVFAADPELFSLTRLANALSRQRSRPVWTPTLPRLLLALLTRLAPGPARALYGESIIDPSAVWTPPDRPLMSLVMGLQRVFPSG